MYAKSLREQLPRLAGEMQGIVAKAKSEGNRGFTSAEREKFHKLESDYTALEDSISMTERSANILDDLRKTDNQNGISQFDNNGLRDVFRTNPRQERDKSPHARAFSNYLKNGIEALDTDQRAMMSATFLNNGDGTGVFQNTMSTTTGSQGGYTVPQGFSDQLERAKKWFGGIDGVVGKFTTETGNPLPWPTVNDTSNRGYIIGQNQQVTETDLVFGQVTFNAYIGCSGLVLIPLALIQDAYFDMDALTAQMLGERLGRLYNWKCSSGTGVNEPTGIVTAALAAGLSYTFPVGETSAIAYNDLVELEHTVDPAYRYNPASYWMFSDKQLKIIKKLVDGQGRPAWLPGLSSSFQHGAAVDPSAYRPTILDHPYFINSDMPVPAANASSIVFGDMSTFKVREVAGGTTVLRLVERYADYLQLAFLAYARFDSQLLNAGTAPLAVGINSAT